MGVGPFLDSRERLAKALAAYIRALREIEAWKKAMGDDPFVRADEKTIMAGNALQDVGLAATHENLGILRDLYESLT